jgi:hypothetical protein
MLERPHLPLAQAHAVRLTKIDIHLPKMPECCDTIRAEELA